MQGLGQGQTSFTFEAGRKDASRKDISVSRAFVFIITVSRYSISLGLIVYTGKYL